MKVCELIERLKKSDPLAEVYFEDKGSWLIITHVVSALHGNDPLNILLLHEPNKE